MKIGILTFHYVNNYGAVLQTYATKHFLESTGYTVEILNYNTSEKYRRNRSKKARLLSLIWSPLRFILGGKEKQKQFNRFRKEELKIQDSVIKSKEELCHYLLGNKFDVVIVGSDQVWNPNLIGHDSSYYLQFSAPLKKIAYAVSFGVSAINDYDRSIILDSIKDFTAISVREETGRQILESVTDRIDVLLDPVFLLTQDEWRKLEPKINVKEKYILCYLMPGDSKLEKRIGTIVQKCHQLTGYEVMYVGRREYKQLLPDGIDIVSASPEYFIHLIDHAEMIFTNSFHGTAFSIIFRKKFYSFVNENLNPKNQLSSRIVDLLKRFNLTERIIYLSSEQNIKAYDDSVLYPESDIDNAIIHSKTFLLDAISL